MVKKYAEIQTQLGISPLAGLWQDFPHYSIPPERWSDADFGKRLHLLYTIYQVTDNVPCSAIYLGFSNTSCHECKLISIKNMVIKALKCFESLSLWLKFLTTFWFIILCIYSILGSLPHTYEPIQKKLYISLWNAQIQWDQYSVMYI